MTQALEHALYAISNAILIPTILALLAMLCWIVALAGGLAREWIGRRKVRASLRQLRVLTNREAANDAELIACLRGCSGGLPGRLADLLPMEPNASEYPRCIENLELEMTAALSKLAWITRIAPMLGLMGTLIPLGPALTGLASGELEKLSSNLVVAFTTTVLGVFLGCVSFTMSLLRKNWYQRDLTELEHAFLREGAGRDADADARAAKPAPARVNGAAEAPHRRGVKAETAAGDR